MRIRLLIILLRYGEVGQCDRAFNSYPFIAKVTGVLIATCWTICRHYRSNGCQVLPRPPRRKKLANIEDELVSADVLYTWREMSLAQRCDRIFTNYGIKISMFAVQAMYRRRRVNYTMPQYVHYSRFSPEELLR